jgi:hypothetical protein
MRNARVMVGMVMSVWLIGAGSGGAQQRPGDCALHAQHMKGNAKAEGGNDTHAAMLSRGATAMGFDQVTTSHHFRLTRNGGSIEVHVNNAEDTATKAAIEQHLREIAAQFARGDFATPFSVHAETPDGVDGLKRLGASVSYTFEPGALGGRVRLVAGNAEALVAVHEFLRYQIREHRTGDPLSVDGN